MTKDHHILRRTSRLYTYGFGDNTLIWCN